MEVLVVGEHVYGVMLPADSISQCSPSTSVSLFEHDVLGRAKEKCQRLLVKHWIVFAYAVSCCLPP